VIASPRPKVHPPSIALSSTACDGLVAMAPRRIDPAHRVNLLRDRGRWVATCACGWQQIHERKQSARQAHHTHALLEHRRERAARPEPELGA
jgi:hypothetical protein